jgi:transcriptional regulator with XRE-family HTH domain
MTFGEAVRSIRRRAGLNARDFGKSIGVSHVSIIHTENGICRLRQPYVDKIYELYGQDPYIMAYSDRVTNSLSPREV